MAIDHFRRAKLMPLLEFYNLAGHENVHKAKTWLLENDSHTIGYAATKPDMLAYADFLKDFFSRNWKSGLHPVSERLRGIAIASGLSLEGRELPPGGGSLVIL